MKWLRFGMIGLIVATLSLMACAEEQGMTTGQTEQEQQTETAPQQAQSEQGQEEMAQQQTTTEQQQAQSTQTAQPATGDEIEIAGIVEQTADGYAIRAADESYQVEGEDLSQMVGKDVRITGTLQESEGQRVISVEEITVLE